MNNKLDQKKFDDIYFEGKPMYDKVNGGTFNVVYLREYIDPECESETFAAYETIYRNVPNKYRSKVDNEKMKMKMLKYCDWNYKDMATNFTNVSNIEIKTEKGKLTTQQNNWLTFINKAGGITGVARSINDVFKILSLK